MRRKLLTFIGIMCAVGTFLAIGSTTQHYRILKTGLQDASFCAISENINCDIVNASSYSEVLGVPIAWWGTFYYGLLTIMCFMGAFSKKDRRATISIAWFMSLAGIPYIFFLSYIAFIVLQTACLECIGMYSASFAAAIGLLVALKLPLKRIPSYIANYFKALLGKQHELGFNPHIWKHIIIISVVFSIAWIGISFYKTKSSISSMRKISVKQQIQAYYAQPAFPITPQPSWAVWGNPNAKVKLVEISEYKCPFCKIAAFTVKPFLYEFRSDMAYYFVNFPIDATCNPAVSRTLHQNACYYAKAGLCANKRGKFWAYHDALFSDQAKLTKKLALDIAESQFGWNRTSFQQCIDSEETEKELAQEIQAGVAMKITGTPSLFLNGRRIRNWRDKKFLQKIVKEEIEKNR